MTCPALLLIRRCSFDRDPLDPNTGLRNQEPGEEGAAKATVSRANYAGVFGATTGDVVRLADTDLYVSETRWLA